MAQRHHYEWVQVGDLVPGQQLDVYRDAFINPNRNDFPYRWDFPIVASCQPAEGGDVENAGDLHYHSDPWVLEFTDGRRFRVHRRHQVKVVTNLVSGS